jgi:hypothetical protein
MKGRREAAFRFHARPENSDGTIYVKDPEQFRHGTIGTMPRRFTLTPRATKKVKASLAKARGPPNFNRGNNEVARLKFMTIIG